MYRQIREQFINKISFFQKDILSDECDKDSGYEPDPVGFWAARLVMMRRRMMTLRIRIWWSPWQSGLQCMNQLQVTYHHSWRTMSWRKVEETKLRNILLCNSFYDFFEIISEHQYSIWQLQWPDFGLNLGRFETTQCSGRSTWFNFAEFPDPIVESVRWPHKPCFTFWSLNWIHCPVIDFIWH